MATTRKAAKRPVRLPVVPDHLDLRDRLYLPSVREAPPPTHNSLRNAKIPVLNQHDTNACTGFSLASVVNYLLLRAQREKESPVSPFMLYSMARRYDEFSGPQTADTGSSLRGGMKGWYKHGVCGQRFWSALNPPAAPKFEEDWWPDAAKRPLGAYYRVDTRSATDMQMALAEVGVLYASAVCHAGWDEGSDLTADRRKGWFIPPKKAGPEDGGHAFAIVGYDARGFLILNSWGTDWGDNGLATLTYEDWLDNAMDCWVAQLGVVTEQYVAVAQAPSLRTNAQKRVTLASDTVLRNREISPFIIDMENNGQLSRTGDFSTERSDLDALVTDHLTHFRDHWKLGNKVIDVAIYAHGGLTGEGTAAATAAKWIPALYDAKIFPIFLMWETDLWSTVKGRCSDLVAALLQEPRPTGGLRDQLQRFLNKRIERALVEPGSFLWDEMKQNAEAVSGNEQSGARLLYAASQNVFAPGNVRLHLIGHSAGAIVHSYVVQELAKVGWTFESVNFMAPAVTVDTFRDTVVPEISKGTVKRYNQFHLSEEMEQKDPTCRPILGYGRSLLYLVSQSFEHGVSTPILGIEEHYKAFVSSVPKAARSRLSAWAAPSAISTSTTHGDFDDDEVARDSVIALIKGKELPEAMGPTAAGARRR